MSRFGQHGHPLTTLQLTTVEVRSGPVLRLKQRARPARTGRAGTLVADFARPLPFAIITSVIGVPEDPNHGWPSTCARWTEVSPTNTTPPPWPLRVSPSPRC